MSGLDAKYSMLTLPYRGKSGYHKHDTKFSQRQVKMIEKLDQASVNLRESAVVTMDSVNRNERREENQRIFQTDQNLNKELEEELERYRSSKKMSRMRRSRRKLPVYDCKQNIVQHMMDNQVFVLSGETGCGKTTQVTQFILDHFIQNGQGSDVRIVCTQPRRVAAMSVADRVSRERGEGVGSGSVGYQIKMDARLPREKGSILYCTSGILLQRFQSDPNLTSFTHILLDEVHERDCITDIILVLLKELIARRHDIKVIIMSATLNGEQFSRFFWNCPVLHVPGFMHPVQAFYLKDVLSMVDYRGMTGAGADDQEQFDEWIYKQQHQVGGPDDVVTDVEQFQIYIIAALINKIHMEEDEGGILVFLPGWEEICTLSRLIDGIIDTQRFTLHSSMSPEDQRLIFDPTPQGVRKIVIATNIAESSVTIDDIVYVIDSGRAKIKMFDVKRNHATLSPHWISQANCTQRKGRAGRLRPGKVYRIFSEAREQQFAEYMVPEIVRCRLEPILLKIKKLGYCDVSRFLLQLLDSPQPGAVSLAISTLTDIGAITTTGELTPLGDVLSSLTVDPQLGKMMILASVFSCLDPILTVVSSLEYKSPFYLTKNNESIKAMEGLAFDTFSDHLTVANAYEGWCSARLNRTKAGCEVQHEEFCRDNSISFKVMNQMEKNKKQYGVELQKLGIIKNKNVWEAENNENSGVEAVVRAVITAALLPNIATIQNEGDKFVLKDSLNQMLDFHPRSVNRSVLSDMENRMKSAYMPRHFVYYELMRTTSSFLTDSTSASKLTLALLASNLKMEAATIFQDENTNVSSVCLQGQEDVEEEQAVHVQLQAGQGSVKLLICSKDEAAKLKRVRQSINIMIQKLICGKRKSVEKESQALMSLLVRVLNADSSN